MENEVLNEIYRKYHEPILNLVENNSGSHEDGEELFQNCLIAIYTKACKDEQFTLRASLYTYIYRVAINLWRKELRKRKQSISLTNLDDSVLKVDSYEIDDLLKFFTEARQSILFWEKFEQLSDKCQRILKHYFNGVAMNEIANSLNYSNGAVRVIKLRCKEKLVNLIREDNRYENLTNN